MERLQSSGEVRFTPAQRDALLNLASQIQTEQGATLDAQEIHRAAVEAGIDPRFVQEAALRLDSPATTPVTDHHLAVAALAALMVFDGLFLGITVRHWFFPVAESLRMPLMFTAAFLFASVYGRHRTLRWISVLAPMVIWLSLAVAAVVAYRLHGSSLWGTVPKLAVTYGLLQVFAAASAALMATLFDRPNGQGKSNYF